MKKEEKDSLFYFMHISWKWAKQRPQFLAECLSKDYLVNVVQKRSYTEEPFRGQVIGNISLIYLWLLPFNSRFRIARILNRFIFRIFYTGLVDRSRIIWVTSPELYWILPPRKNNQVLIYDCMDDMLSFDRISKDRRVYSFYRKAEDKLLSESDVVFSSSSHLRDVLKRRYNLNREVYVVNNGLTLNGHEQGSNKEILRYDHSYVNIVYIGTVSQWMDWDLILRSLEVDDTLLYHVVGPIEFDGPKHDRILYYGTVDHHLVFSCMSQADILIMPFVINELVKSVNPVKLYEYIYSGKAVLSVRYAETEKFDDFVWLFSDFDEYISVINKVKQESFSSKKDITQCHEFCRANDWESRYRQIKAILQRVLFD